MCGRFVRYRSIKEIARKLGVPVETVLEEFEDDLPRYNISPGTAVVAALHGKTGLRIGRLQWGLVPAWTRDLKAARRPINARAETAAERPSFANLLRRRRCVVPADGYYEWKSTPQGKQPYYLAARDGKPLMLAALWDLWRSPDQQALATCALFTVGPNAEAAGIHDRMPAVIPLENCARWLDPDLKDASEASRLLHPAPDGSLVCHPVGRAVSRAASEGRQLIEPLPEPEAEKPKP